VCVCASYFTLPKEKMSLEQEEEMMNSERGAYCMAHNGWVMSDDPLRNFAEPGMSVLLLVNALAPSVHSFDNGP